MSESEFRSRMKGTTVCSDSVGMANLIVEAKKLSINVVAMDVEDPTPYIMKNGQRVKDVYDEDRLQYSNPAWAKTVNEQMKQQSNGAKYIMIAGNFHTNKINDPSLRGVDSILNIPSIDIFSNSLARTENKAADALGIKHPIPDPAIRPNANTIVPGTVETSDFIAIVPNPAGDPLVCNDSREAELRRSRRRDMYPRPDFAPSLTGLARTVIWRSVLYTPAQRTTLPRRPASTR